MINNPIIYKFSKDFTNHGKKSKSPVALSFRPFPNMLKYMNYRWDLPTKKKFFRHILKSSVSMCNKSGSQFFRNTTGIQPAQDAFDESKFIMNYLIILGVINTRVLEKSF